MMMAMAGLVVYYLGLRQALAWWLPFTLLVLSVPLPELIRSTLALPLQFKASELGAGLLEWRNVPVRLAGNVIQLPGHRLFVTEACSGLRSLTALLSLALLMGGIWLQRPALRVALVAGRDSDRGGDQRRSRLPHRVPGLLRGPETRRRIHAHHRGVAAVRRVLCPRRWRGFSDDSGRQVVDPAEDACPCIVRSLRYLPLVVLALGAAALLRIGGQADTPLRGSLDSIPHELAGLHGPGPDGQQG